MADAPALLSQFYLTIDGRNASDALMRDLVEITVESSLHLPDVATLTLYDAALRWIDDATLAPGTTVQVAARASGHDRVIFDGEIVEIEPDFGPTTHRLVVRAFDRLHRLGRGRYVRSFLNVTDGDLVRQIAREVGLQASVGPTPRVNQYVFQGNETNGEFLRRRAATLGYMLFVRGQTLHFETLQTDGPIVDVEWGVTLREFRPRLATSGQVDGVVVRGWDPSTRREIVGQARNGQGGPTVGVSESGGAMAREAFNLAAQTLVTDRPVRTQAAADGLAQAQADRAAGRFIEAEGVCSGIPALVAGSPLRVSAVGDRFGGAYCVTRATHVYNAREGYLTHFSISGQHPLTLSSLLAPEPPGVPAGGVVIGIVTDNQDPAGQGRVKVKYPWLSADHTSDWARIAVPGGGAGRGIEFLPEVNDEVLVGFELGDIHYPYVLGGLWNGQDAPPQRSNQLVRGGRVQRRVIRSRGGHTVTFDDDDGGGGITIADRAGNTVVLNSAANTLTIAARGDLTLEARGRVRIKGLGVAIDGGIGPVDVNGSVISMKDATGPVK